jgi:hypothetical protein
LATKTPPPEQVGLVEAGGTATTLRPASVAVALRMSKNADQPTSLMRLARG